MQRLNEGTLSTYYVHNFVLLANAFTCILIFRQKNRGFCRPSKICHNSRITSISAKAQNLNRKKVKN
jgi:hypothetical protein